MENKSAILDGISKSAELTNSDCENITNINRWLLTPLGVWPMEQDTNIIIKLTSYLRILICYFLILFLLIPCALHSLLVERNIHKRIKMFGPMIFCTMALCKYFFLIIKRKKIRECINHIDIDWRRIKTSRDRNIMMNDARIGRFIAILSATFTYTGAFFYRTILPFAVPRRVLPDNTTVRPLQYPIYQKLINTQKTPNYEIAFTTQWFGGFVVYTIAVSACSIAAVFTLHACGQLNIVMSRLNDLVECSLEAPQKLKEKFGEIVELHTRALQFVVKIEAILNEICFIEFIGCTMNICLCGYYLIMELEQAKITRIAIVSYSFLITSFTYNIFIFCHIGELLNQQVKNVGVTAYMVNWYELPGKTASGLILISRMSNCPVNITAGKMVALSYDTFCGVLKTAVAYFNLLNSVVL